MPVCFYDSKGIIHHEFVPEGQTVTGNFYLSVLESLSKRIRRVQLQYSAPGSWFLLHDSAPVHRAVAVQEFLTRKQVCVLHHPLYSPDLSPCDYFLFPKLKLPLKGRLFEDVQDIQAAVTSSLRAIPQEDVQRSFQSLLDRATCCIDVLWIKYRQYSSLLFRFDSITSVSLHNYQTVYIQRPMPPAIWCIFVLSQHQTLYVASMRVKLNFSISSHPSAHSSQKFLVLP